MTMDNGMDVSPSWEELREERDALADKLAESDHALMQLGRLKAEWQVEALDHWLGLNLQGERFEYLYKLRRQAEEPIE